MALTQEQKDELAEHYRGKDIYDPSKAPEQEVPTFMPKTTGKNMACGGMVAETDHDSMSDLMKKSPTHKGMVDGVVHMDEGGIVQADENTFSEQSPLAQLAAAAGDEPPDSADDIKAALTPKLWAPGGSAMPKISALPPKPSPMATIPSQSAPESPYSVSSSTDTDRGGGLDALVAPETSPMTPAAVPAAPARAPMTPKSLPAPSGPPDLDLGDLSGITAAAPAQSGAGKLTPDQRDEMAQYLAALAKGPSGGQRAARGLAALADGIMQGVARAGNPGFAKNITESENSQRQQLLEALRAKYDKQFRGQELNISQQRANDENTRAAAAIAAENARSAGERKTQERGQDLEAASNRGRIAYETQNAALERAQAAQNAQQSAAKYITDASQKAGTIRTFLANHGYGNAPTSQQAQAAISKLAGDQGGSSPVTAGDQHARAVAWAKANPSDPRAARIMAINGQ